MSTDFTSLLQNALTPAYTLERELSGGGMSRVFVANDVALGRKVVVKVLPPELAAGVNHERFRREIQVAAQLQHPHVVPLLSAGERDSLIWYTMPFINGHSLREALAKGERFTVKDVVRILRDVAEALDYAHGLGVIHRDIKPGNVLLMGSHALVTDFGVAKAISAAMPTSGFTSAGMAIGTPAYMAPEQIAADPAADHRMDLYALGLLSYEMLTGHVPFKEDSPQKTMAAQLTREPEPITNSRADVPEALTRLTSRLLAKQPEDRPQVAAEVVTILDDIAMSSGQTLAPLRAVSKPSWLRVGGVVAAGAAVVALAWAAGERTGTEQASTFVRDSIAAADTAQLAPLSSALLTREDSMAIAKAVADRMAQRVPTVAKTPAVAAPGAVTATAPNSPAAMKAAPTDAREVEFARALIAADSARLIVMADSIRTIIQRQVLDSLVLLSSRLGPNAVRLGSATRELARATEASANATAAPPVPPVQTIGARGEPRRVVVAMPRPSRDRPDLDLVGRALADSLRLGLDKHPRYVTVPADSVAMALRETRTVNAVQERLKADIIVSIALHPSADSVERIITVRDLAVRTNNARVVISGTSAKTPTDGLDRLVPEVLRLLFDIERGRIRQPAPPPR
ncbi:MAG: serine/threonine protein kinase [Gemmatimonadaceae bacterium]|nr:serine/threonine protein kinase [Gemmatimonadaceae bacterium]